MHQLCVTLICCSDILCGSWMNDTQRFPLCLASSRGDADFINTRLRLSSARSTSHTLIWVPAGSGDELTGVRRIPVQVEATGELGWQGDKPRKTGGSRTLLSKEASEPSVTGKSPAPSPLTSTRHEVQMLLSPLCRALY